MSLTRMQDISKIAKKECDTASNRIWYQTIYFWTQFSTDANNTERNYFVEKRQRRTNNCQAVSHHCLLLFSSQAQFSHIGASLHTRTPFSYRVPADSQPVFLLVNLLYAAVPQALCYRCRSRPAFFIRPTLDKKTE